MPSQLEASTKSAKKLAVGCGIIIVIILLYGFISPLFRSDPPPCNPYPSTEARKYKDLPILEFESLQLEQETQPEYKIDTVDQTLPIFHSILNVYKTKTPRQSLTAHDEAIELARSIGFRADEQNISATEMRWMQDGKTLNVDKLYKTAHLETDYSKNQYATGPHTILSDSNPYISTAQNFLNKTSLLPSTEIEDATKTVTYMKLNDNYELVKAKSPSDAGFVRVDFFTKLVGTSPIYSSQCTEAEQTQIEENSGEYTKKYEVKTLEPFKSDIFVVLGGTGGFNDLYELRVVSWERESYSTYKLVTTAEAWEKVRAGEGALRSIYEINSDPFQPDTSLEIETLLLTDVDIIYYTTEEYIQYLQPVYEFKGIGQIKDSDNLANFTIYYPAIKQSSESENSTQ